MIDIKKDANAQLILNYLYKNTDLQVSYNYNVIAIVNKTPKQLGLAQMLDAFIEHRKDVIEKRSYYLLDKKVKRVHILEGLKKAISILDEIIALIRSSKDKADSKIKIMDKFDFSEPQAEAIVSMRLYRLSNTDITLLIEELKQLEQEIEELKEILSNSKKLRKVMIDELKEVKKTFKTPRLSQVEDHIEEIVIEKEDMIASEQVMCSISRDGYAKRVSLRSYQAANQLLPGMKENDQLVAYGEVNTLDRLIFFTSAGTYGYLPIYELNEAKWKDVGTHLNSNLKIESSEKITDAYILKNFKTQAYVISISKLGLIKKSALSEYEVNRNNKTMMNMKVLDGDEVLTTLIAYDMDEIFLLSKNGYIVRYPISMIPETATRSKGVKAIKLQDDELVSACLYQGEGSQIIFFAQDGYMKRMKLADIETTGRPVKGNMICKKQKSKPYVLQHMKIASLADEFTLITSEDAKKVICKDVTIMSKDATFSSMFKEMNQFYFLKSLEMIRFIEISTFVESNESITNLSLFDEE